MNLIIREANETDIDRGLLNSYIEGYRFHQNGRPDIFKDVSNELLKKRLIEDLELFKTIIILSNEEIVGHLTYEIKGRNIKKLYIHQLVVLEEYRNKSLGKKLMNEATKIAKEQKCKIIELNCWIFNENAIKMYEHIGYNRQRIVFEKKV